MRKQLTQSRMNGITSVFRDVARDINSPLKAGPVPTPSVTVKDQPPFSGKVSLV